jgi:hypothetical protein
MEHTCGHKPDINGTYLAGSNVNRDPSFREAGHSDFEDCGTQRRLAIKTACLVGRNARRFSREDLNGFAARDVRDQISRFATIQARRLRRN